MKGVPQLVKWGLLILLAVALPLVIFWQVGWLTDATTDTQGLIIGLSCLASVGLTLFILNKLG